MWDLSLWHTSYLVVAGGLSCPAACEILVPRPGIEPIPHVLTGRFLTTGPPEKSHKRCLTSLVFLCTHSLSHVWFCDPMDYLSMEFSRQEYWSRCYFLFETQGPNIERYMKVAAVVQNGDQGYRVIHDEKKRTTIQISLDHFFKTVARIESSKEPEHVPSPSDVSEIAASPPSPVADGPSALPSATFSPSSSQ